MSVLATATSPDGRTVELTAERWAHVVARHPELTEHLEHVLGVVREPEHRTRDPIAGRERYWSRVGEISGWLRVVIDFSREPAGVVTAFANRKAPPEWKP